MIVTTDKKVAFTALCLVALRVALGSIFVISGITKLMEPTNNFIDVIARYELVSFEVAQVVARTMPWIELSFGVFVIVGIWIKISTGVLVSMLMFFITIVGQAIARRLPIKECGCFGQFMALPLPIVMAVDSITIALFAVLFKNVKKASRFGLGNYFSGK